MITKFVNANIITADEDFTVIKNGIIYIQNDKILYVGKEDIFDKFDKLIDVKGDIIMPGLINTHTHLGMSLFRGISENQNLQAWLYDVIFPMEAKLTANDVFYGTMLSMIECIRGGTTYVADSYYFNQEAVKAAQITGIGIALLGAEMDLNKSTAHVIDGIKTDFLKFNNISDNIKYIPGCHSIYTCSQKLLEEIADFCIINKAFPYIHLSETLKEVGDCSIHHNGLTPPQYLHKIGYFDNGGICAHGVYLDKDDIALLKQSNVSIAHCPASNLKLGSGIAPVYSMLKYDLNVCLGTDSSASNNALDMFREMYLSSALQKGIMNNSSAVSPIDSILMATRNGAIALGLKDRGVIKKGYKADIIRIDTSCANFMPHNDFVSSVVYSTTCKDVIMTMAEGKILYENGKFASEIDLNQTFIECEKAVNRLKS